MSSFAEYEISSPLWRIKYRPRNLENLRVYYPKIYEEFTGYIKSKNFPHLMLVGPSASGKTLLAELLARELLGPEYDINCKILYADDPIGKDERAETKRAGHISTKRLGSGAGQYRNFRPFIHSRVLPFVSTQKFGESPFKILIE